MAAGGASVRVNHWPDQPGPLVRIMSHALAQAGVRPDEVDVVYAAANSTALDGVEAAALQSLFGGSRAVVTSIKGALGESGAAGAAACVAALLCGRERVGAADSRPRAPGSGLRRTAHRAPGGAGAGTDRADQQRRVRRRARQRGPARRGLTSIGEWLRCRDEHSSADFT